jgi:hypothetical protein
VASGDQRSAFAEMLRRLETDPLWAREYEEFVRQVSFAGVDEVIHFTDALAACGRLVKLCVAEKNGMSGYLRKYQSVYLSW